MMDGSIQSQIVQFNLLFKRYDDIYRRAAKQFDMPELTLWILYALREKPDCTQKDLTDLTLCWNTRNIIGGANSSALPTRERPLRAILRIGLSRRNKARSLP